MTALVVALVALALVAGFCWGRGTAGANLEAERIEVALEQARLAAWARELTVHEAVGGWVHDDAAGFYDWADEDGAA